MLFNKSMRDSVYKDLVQLKPLFADVAKNGQESAYTMTNDDQKAISSLYETARASVPESLKKQLDQVAKDIGIEQLTGSKVSAVLEKAGMATASSSAPEKRYIVKLKDGKKLSSFKSKAQSSGVKALEPLGKNKTEFKDMYVVEMKESRSAGFKAAAKQYQTAAAKIAKMPEVEFVEQVQQYEALSADTQYPYQWSLKNNGKNRAANADIQFEQLQKLMKGKKLRDTVIAVVDTGVDHTLAADLSGSVKKTKAITISAAPRTRWMTMATAHTSQASSQLRKTTIFQWRESMPMPKSCLSKCWILQEAEIRNRLPTASSMLPTTVQKSLI